MNTYVPRLARAFLTFALVAFVLSAMNAQRLDDLRWKKRVIIIYAPNGSEQKLSQQEQLLHSHNAELKERDVTSCRGSGDRGAIQPREGGLRFASDRKGRSRETSLARGCLARNTLPAS